MPGTSDAPAGPARPAPRPRIGVTAWRRTLPTSLGERTDLFTLAAEYVDALREAGALPILLPHHDDPDPMLDVVDGLLLSGGGDLHPHAYGAVDEHVSVDVNLDADHWEIALVRAAERRCMPLLGICRGMQVMAVAFGGALRQDISGTDGHPAMADLTASRILAQRHGVTLQPGSRCAAIYCAPVRRVNTIHHQAVADSGALRVAARSDDGLIEAVEARAPWPALGVQWHPEKMDGSAEAAAEQALFRQFVADAATYRAARDSQVHS
jgi:putative glutamine amidotransferase